MARIPRTVIPGLAHHITQRGNRRQRTFFVDGDYAEYLDLMRRSCDWHGVEILAYCLMPNHVHLAAVPATEDALRKAMGEAHRRYTTMVNQREGWTGCLWQGRFESFVMDERYTLNAARYIERNPVDANLVERPEEWPWSSARAHLSGRDDDLVKVAPLLERVEDWAGFLRTDPFETFEEFHQHEKTGRPLGSEEFVIRLEAQVGRRLRPLPKGPAPTVGGRYASAKDRPSSDIVSPLLYKDCTGPRPVGTDDQSLLDVRRLGGT